jgi:hypothetical protein
MGKHQEAFYEMLAARSNPKAKRASKGLGAFAAFEERVKREMAEAGEYPESDLRSNPYYSNPGADGRLSSDEMAIYKRHIQNFLDAGMSHNDVRKQLGNMSFPLYQAIRRSGGTKGAQPVHRGSSHLLRNPSTGMSVPEAGTEFTALSTYHDIAGMGQYDSQMYMRFVVNADGSATSVWGGSRGNSLPANAVRNLFETGHCGGLGNVTSLSKPEIA